MSVITKEELLSMPELHKQIQTLQERHALYEAKAMGGAIEYKERVQTSISAKSSIYPDMAVDLERDIEKLEAQLIPLISKVEVFAKELPDPLERDVIRFRYIYGYDWGKIGELVKYSARHCYNIDRRVVKKMFI